MFDGEKREQRITFTASGESGRRYKVVRVTELQQVRSIGDEGQGEWVATRTELRLDSGELVIKQSANTYVIESTGERLTID